MNYKQLEKYNKSRKIVQICFVTYDYKKAIEDMYNYLNFGPWTILAHASEVTKDVKFNGEPVNEPFRFYCAFTFMGDIQIEVIQPMSGPNPYEKFLAEKGPGIHHIKECIPNNDELLKKIADYEKSGSKVIYQGRYQEDRFFYLDTMDILGGLYEIGNCAEVTNHPTLIGYYPER